MTRRNTVLALVLAACGSDGAPSQSNGGSGGADESDGGEQIVRLSPSEAADAFLAMLSEWPNSTLHEDAPCPIEHPDGDAFFHVTDQTFPSHVFSASPLEFQVTSTYGPGPAAIGGIVACVDGGTGFLTIEVPTVEGMPMMDDPILLCARGESGSDAQLVGHSIAVALGVTNDDGDAGLYSTALAQVCDEDGSGCAQACDDPIAPVSATALAGTTICTPDQAAGEDGSFAVLGRTDTDVLGQVDNVPVASCITIDFGGGAMAHTVRVVASWSRADTCGLDACADPGCGTGHAFGVFTSTDGATFSFRGVARGSETTALVPADPQAPDLPLVGEHFLVDDDVQSALVCRLGYGPEADQLVVDHVELCP